MRNRTCHVLCLGLLWGAAASASAAPAAVPVDEAPAASAWTWFGDAMLREDHVSDIPRADDSIQRVQARGRFGVLYDPIPTLQFGAAIKLSAASNGNQEDRSYNLNERSNDVALDQFFLRWRPSENAAVLLGKTPLPLELTPLVWDRDLRPAGISGDFSAQLGEFDRINFIAGYFAGSHLYGDDSRIGALQAGYRWHEGAPTNAGVLLSYLDFSDLDQLVRQGLTRTNRRIGTHLISDYHLLDMQLFGRTRVGDWPLELRLDLLRNLGADDMRDGARASLVLGDSLQPRGWEFGLAVQRIQRDAAMAAFNSDDWWFHSFARGQMPWVAYGLSATWSVRLAGFHELRDGLHEHTDRVLLDVFARW